MSNPTTPLKALRAKCMDCAGGSTKEVRLCPATDCPSWQWRFGKRPETIAKRRPDLMDRKKVIELGRQDAAEGD